ncbi:MAG: polyamine aminopropyltransferase [Bacilli bacterium]
MDKWFSEYWTDNIQFSIKIKEHLFSQKTPFQKIDFYDSYELGRFFTLDDIMMANEKDEFIYHEMMIHFPLSVNPSISNVLVIGGGDGGSVRELCKYPTIKSITMVEIDEIVVRKCQELLPQTAAKLTDPRVKLIFTDGSAFVKQTHETYDLIVIDSTDPIGPGEGLFSREFYKNCANILKPNGILVNQHESPYFEKTRQEMLRAHEKLREIFHTATVYQAFIPTYPSGHWLFGFASNTENPQIIKGSQSFIDSLNLKYYNFSIHQASLVLPNYVKQILSK